MDRKQQARLRMYGTASALLAELTHLAWEHFHGGVLSHHLLNRSDLPAISNAWGILLLPALVWFLIGRIHNRHEVPSDARPHALRNSVMARFVSSLLFGILLSTCFTLGYATLTEYLFLGLLLLALLQPVYRAECVLGFVLGMTFVFGVVLPTAIASILAAMSLLLHRILYPILVQLWAGLKRKKTPAS